MRKFQKAAVVVALLGSVGFLGAGAAQAHGGEGGGSQTEVRHTETRQTETRQTETRQSEPRGGGGAAVDSHQSQACTGQVDAQQGLVDVQDLGVAANAIVGIGNPVGKLTSVACPSALTFG
ncbi:hypothetical protein [Streptomyces similanensis]|uniref:Secreted protein n=1 Tax=Streptomyces similanensis TaxID=1274988 RepID=A0ABP9K4Y0_9ACTN|nr:hypothetical protein HUT11_02705 [Streptomyces seoulensis]